MDEIKEMIENVVAKLKDDKDLLANFKTQPIKVIESLLGVDLPDEVFEQIITGVKAKLKADDAKETIEDVKDKLGDAKELLGGILGKLKK